MDLETKKEQYNILIQLAIPFINVPLDQLDSALRSAMKKLGEYVGADRFYIFSYDCENGTGTNRAKFIA